MKTTKSYNRVFLWQQQSMTQEQSFGAQKETWVQVQQLYGYFQPLRSMEELAYSMRLPTTPTKIRLQGYRLAIKFSDRLVDKETNDLYYIDGITQDKAANETIVMCHRAGEPGAESAS